MLVHSLYLYKGGGRGVVLMVCFPCVRVYSLYASVCARAVRARRPSNSRWTADMPGHTAGKEKREKRQRSCHKHGNQRDMKREVRIKEQREKREGISSLIFSLSQLCTFTILSSSINCYKEKNTFWITSKTETQLPWHQPSCTRRTFHAPCAVVLLWSDAKAQVSYWRGVLVIILSLIHTHTHTHTHTQYLTRFFHYRSARHCFNNEHRHTRHDGWGGRVSEMCE